VTSPHVPQYYYRERASERYYPSPRTMNRVVVAKGPWESILHW